MNVLGVDGTPNGRAVVACKERQMRVRQIARLEDIFEQPPYPNIVAVDAPIGLLDAYEIGGRECDRKARRDLEERGSSVFVPPVRAVLAARTYEEAMSWEAPVRFRVILAVAAFEIAGCNTNQAINPSG